MKILFKRIVLLSVLIWISNQVQSQNVGINNTGALPDSSAILDVSDTTKGILIPRMSSVQRAGIAGPAEGLMVYDTTTTGFWFYNGAAWSQVGGGDTDWTISGADQYSGVTGNVGIGIVGPLAKTHIVQTGAVDGLRSDHSGSAIANVVLHSGSGTGYGLYHSGTGMGHYLSLSNALNASTGIDLQYAGTGRGMNVNLTNSTNADIGLGIFHSGTGRGQYVGITNPTNAAPVIELQHGGIGTGLYVNLSNVNNTTVGVFSLQAGTGPAIYGQSNGIGVWGYVTGTTGNGNAAEFYHAGTNGPTVDVFMGNPGVTPGPANTTSDYTALNVNHMGTGVSGLGGQSKSAISASNYSGNPTINVISNGDVARQGVLSVANPNGFVDPEAVYGYSYSATNPGFGVGVKGVGGWYGVHGIAQGALAPTAYAVFGSGDYGGTGAKYFSIDHPLDPENKILNHYSIESNEVTNMYRGIVTLDANGQAVVELPDYFDAANIEPSYQLTAIGTPNPPYVLEEEANNKFVIGGTPNTKVSWTVYAKRNDATIRYFSENGKHYDQEEVVKPEKMKGKYYTPAAYGKPESMGIHYDENFEKTKRKAGSVKHHAMPKPESSNIKSVEPSTEK